MSIAKLPSSPGPSWVLGPISLRWVRVLGGGIWSHALQKDAEAELLLILDQAQTLNHMAVGNWRAQLWMTYSSSWVRADGK
jgi:hypothetical protein